MTSNIRNFRDPLIWTHFLWFCNGFLYWFAQYKLLSLLVFCHAILSWCYHRSKESSDVFFLGERLFIHACIACISVHLFVECSALQISLSLLWLIGCLIVLELDNHRYGPFHVLWHVMVFLAHVLIWGFLV